MFALREIAVSLTFFVLVYGLLSAVVGLAWRSLRPSPLPTNSCAFDEKAGIARNNRDSSGRFKRRLRSEFLTQLFNLFSAHFALSIRVGPWK